jgi:branched-chain amino acid transport system substrate-binding protein
MPVKEMNYKYLTQFGSTLFLLLTLVLTACGTGDQTTPAPAATASENFKGTVVVGGIFDTSGLGQQEGRDYAAGALAYAAYLNSKGGAEGYKIDLRASDFAGQAPVAIENYQRLLKEGAVAFLAWDDADTLAVTRQLNTGRTPLLSASYDEELVRDLKQNPYNFMIAPSYADQIKIALLYAKQNRPDPTRTDQTGVGFFYSDNNFGRYPYQVGRDYASAHNISWYHESVVSADTDKTQILNEANRLRNAHPEYTFFQAKPYLVAESLNIIKAVQTQTIMLGLSGSASPDLYDLASKGAEKYLAFQVVSYPDDQNSGLDEIRRWLDGNANKLLYPNPVIGAPLKLSYRFTQGWVTMKVLAEGIRQAIVANPPATGQALTLNGDKVKEGLESLKQFDTGGITPPLSFSPTKHKGTDTVRLIKMENKKWKIINDNLSLSALEAIDSQPPTPTPVPLSPSPITPKR